MAGADREPPGRSLHLSCSQSRSMGRDPLDQILRPQWIARQRHAHAQDRKRPARTPRRRHGSNQPLRQDADIAHEPVGIDAEPFERVASACDQTRKPCSCLRGGTGGDSRPDEERGMAASEEPPIHMGRSG